MVSVAGCSDGCADCALGALTVRWGRRLLALSRPHRTVNGRRDLAAALLIRRVGRRVELARAVDRLGVSQSSLPVPPIGMADRSPRRCDRSRRRSGARKSGLLGGRGDERIRDLSATLVLLSEQSLNLKCTQMCGRRGFDYLKRIQRRHEFIPLCGVARRVSDLKIGNPRAGQLPSIGQRFDYLADGG